MDSLNITAVFGGPDRSINRSKSEVKESSVSDIATEQEEFISTRKKQNAVKLDWMVDPNLILDLLLELKKKDFLNKLTSKSMIGFIELFRIESSDKK